MQNFTTKQPPDLSVKDKDNLFRTAVEGLYNASIIQAHGKNETVRTLAGAMLEAYTSMLKLSGRNVGKTISVIREAVLE